MISVNIKPKSPFNFSSKIIQDSEELNQTIREYINEARLNLIKSVKNEERKCSRRNENNPRGYAECMTAFEKHFRIDMIKINYKILFLQKKIEDCMQDNFYKDDNSQRTIYCKKIAKNYLKQIFELTD